MALTLKTPGVYIEELNAFPSSVVQVATAIPAFVGYTQRAERGGKSLVNKPTRITSLAEYHSYFGMEFTAKFKVEVGSADDPNAFMLDEKAMVVTRSAENQCYMYHAIRMFYANGGGTCYITSCGNYADAATVKIEKDKIEAGIKTLLKQDEPTMVLLPDATLLEEADCYALYQNVLGQCAKMQDRVGIFDVYNGHMERTYDDADVITKFREGVGINHLKYGSAYYPWVQTSIVQANELDFNNFADLAALKGVIVEPIGKGLIDDLIAWSAPAKLTEVYKKFRDSAALQVNTAAGKAAYKIAYDEAIAAKKSEADAKKAGETAKGKAEGESKKVTDGDIKNENGAADKAKTAAVADKDAAFWAVIKDTPTSSKSYEEARKEIQVKKLIIGQALLASSPTYKNLLVEIRRQMNLLPPSAAMAGVFSMVDFTRGVWKAPANVSLNSVVAPAVNIDNDQQEDLNVDGINGKSINVIRSFPGAGVIVWGARTLDGNSQDWRYINVRRTMIMIEQSIKNASKGYVFEPNVQSTWSDMRIMIDSFLNGLWKQGALAGPSPSSAYLVQVGLGSTMTPNDILEGIMRITIKVAISRPAEFIVLTFQQKMQEGGGGE